MEAACSARLRTPSVIAVIVTKAKALIEAPCTHAMAMQHLTGLSKNATLSRHDSSCFRSQEMSHALPVTSVFVGNCHRRTVSR